MRELIPGTGSVDHSTGKKAHTKQGTPGSLNALEESRKVGRSFISHPNVPATPQHNETYVNGHAMQFASKKLQKDREVVLAAAHAEDPPLVFWANF